MAPSPTSIDLYCPKRAARHYEAVRPALEIRRAQQRQRYIIGASISFVFAAMLTLAGATCLDKVATAYIAAALAEAE